MAQESEIMNRRDRILERLRELGADGPKRSLGQNFLISDQVIEKILVAVKAEPFSEMIEVGPGLGALTEDLLLINKPLTLLELDSKFVQSWRERAQAGAAIRVVEGDALRVNWCDIALPEDTLFVSNLPYQISSSLVIERSLEPAGVSRMILMFQKEVAQRICARIGSKDFGLLTVIAQAFWEPSIICDAGPRDFFPPPKVASRVLQFKRRKIDWFTQDGASAKGLLGFAKAAYSQRRKLVSRNLLGSYFGGDKTLLPRIEALLVHEGLTITARAEELDPNAFVRLYLSVVKEGLKPRHGG
jgi:16S rRNA (adenine1518-N6/adenine1519-N6)-dimethyltransferase